MEIIPIELSTVEEVKSFVIDITPFSFPMDICSDRYIINAKSIMGLFSLDLTKPLELKVYAGEGEDLSDLYDALEPYRLKSAEKA